MNIFKPVVITPRPDGSLGVENIKLIITTLVTFAVDLHRAVKTKNYFDLPRILFNLVRAGNVVAYAQLAWAEIKDTTLTESNDIHLHFTDVLKLDDVEAERVIEYAFGLVPRVYAVIMQGAEVISTVQALYAETKTVLFPDAPGGLDRIAA